MRHAFFVQNNKYKELHDNKFIHGKVSPVAAAKNRPHKADGVQFVIFNYSPS